MLLVSPSLAQTLGLEEALLLQLLLEMQQLQGAQEISFTEQQRTELLPFWSFNQFGNILKRLQAQGVIQVRGAKPWTIICDLPDMADQPKPITEPASTPTSPVEIEAIPTAPVQTMATETVPVYSMMNEARQRNQYDDDLAYLKPSGQAKPAGRARKSRMHQEWEPTEDFPQLLAFHDIPLEFALSELAKFRQYYTATDRTEISWDVRYLNWVQRSWHDSLNAKGRNDRQKATNGEPADSAREKRSQVRDALRNIRDTDW